jgi:hypothetical protein
MSRLLAFLFGVGVAGVIGYSLYKVFVEPTIEEQRKMIQALWGKIQELELRVHELERDWSQNEEEHLFLRNEIEKLRQASLPIEMRNKLNELLTILDAIDKRQHQKAFRTTSLTVPIYA